MTRAAAKPDPIPDADAEVLRYCGFMGHTYVIVIDDKERDRRCGLETSSLARARKTAKDDYSGKSPVIYQQVAIRKWKPVKL